MSGSNKNHSGIFSYLQEQSAITVNRLYGSDALQETNQAPFVCKAVFQSLSAMAKNYLMRLLFYEGEITSKQMSVWTTNSTNNKEKHDAAIGDLIKLRILVEIFPEGGDGDMIDDDIMIMANPSILNSDSNNGKYIVNQYFRKSFQLALTKPQEPWEDHLMKLNQKLAIISNITSDGSVMMNYERFIPSKDEIKRISMLKWDTLLRFILGLSPVSSTGTGTGIGGTSGGMGMGMGMMLPKPKAGGTIVNFVTKTGMMNDGYNKNKQFHKQQQQQQQQGMMDVNVNSLKITESGYSYLLLSYQKQVWIFVYELITGTSTSTSTNTDIDIDIDIDTDISIHNKKEEILSLLFMISYW